MLLFLFLISCKSILAIDLRIHNTNDFVEFSTNVSNGLNYSGTTVYLDDDIDFSYDFSQHFSPIGKDSSNCFLGTFDGQGHKISNLKVNSSSFKYSGLFGYSNGITIKNTILDDSCYFESSFSSTSNNALIGGVIGYCSSINRECVIENIVNMANIFFSGNVSWRLWVGGITGRYHVSNHKAKVINSMNYGTIHTSGNGDIHTYIGGIIGECYGNYTHNCLNHGTIINNGSSQEYSIGGIIGTSWNDEIINCVNTGIINSIEGVHIGNIVGTVPPNVNINITNCYWTIDTNYDNSYGFNEGSNTLEDKINNVSVIELTKETLIY